MNLSPKGVISRHDLDMFVPLVCASPYCLGQEQILGAEDYRVTGDRIRTTPRSTTFGGSRISPKAFRTRLREDLTTLLDLLAKGAINPPIAARFPLTEASAAMVLAESRTVQGKVFLIP